MLSATPTHPLGSPIPSSGAKALRSSYVFMHSYILFFFSFCESGQDLVRPQDLAEGVTQTDPKECSSPGYTGLIHLP